jgi:hypothetical protein
MGLQIIILLQRLKENTKILGKSNCSSSWESKLTPDEWKADTLPLQQVTAFRLKFISGVSLSQGEAGTQFAKKKF